MYPVPARQVYEIGLYLDTVSYSKTLGHGNHPCSVKNLCDILSFQILITPGTYALAAAPLLDYKAPTSLIVMYIN